MIRAKTLLASVLLAGTAVTVFALNTDHDGYTPVKPAPSDGVQQKVGVDPALQKPVVEPSGTIARLPKLAPSTSAQTSTPHIPTPVISQTTEPFVDVTHIATKQMALTPTQQISDSVTTSGSDLNEPPKIAVRTALAQQSFAQRKAPEPNKADTQIGIPLPTRLPEENRLLRAKHLARLQQRPAAGSEDAFFDPAVPAITNRRTLRLKQRQRANRVRRNAARTATKQRQQTPNPTSEVGQVTPKPVFVHRHREPFDDIR